jgi:hypothetical protein
VLQDAIVEHFLSMGDASAPLTALLSGGGGGSGKSTLIVERGGLDEAETRMSTMNIPSGTSSNRTLAGKCLCGAIHYAVADKFRYALNCHCSDCRRATGSAFKAFAGIERDKLGITKGKENILIFGDENADHDVHCKVCGSLLYSVVRDGAFVHVTLGTLVDVPTIRPTAHIFVGDKAPWFEITDNLPQHEEHE